MPLSADADQLAANLRAALSPRTCLVVFSHVSCETGARAAVEVIRDVVGPEIAVMVDAAQSVDQAVHVSCAYFTSANDLNRLANAVDEIARGG